MVRVVIGHLISPDVAGTDARVIHSFIQQGYLCRSGLCGSLTLWVWFIMSGTVCWCCWLMVRVVLGHLISPDVAGTDARVIQFNLPPLRSQELPVHPTLYRIRTGAPAGLCIFVTASQEFPAVPCGACRWAGAPTS